MFDIDHQVRLGIEKRGNVPWCCTTLSFEIVLHFIIVDCVSGFWVLIRRFLYFVILCVLVLILL